MDTRISMVLLYLACAHRDSGHFANNSLSSWPGDSLIETPDSWFFQSERKQQDKVQSTHHPRETVHCQRQRIVRLGGCALDQDALPLGRRLYTFVPLRAPLLL